MEKYDSIFQWNMTPEESGTYKLAVIYENEFLNIFKNNMDGTTRRKNVLPMRGDPRKSNLFRYCWKLKRETKGLLDSTQYKIYIRANLTILFINFKKGSKAGKIYIEPNSICGDKAWIRWKVYERWYNNKLAIINATLPPPNISSISPKIIKEIDKTKKFIFEKCEGQPTKEKIGKFITDGFVKFWLMSGKISKYYFVWSPLISSICDIKKVSESCFFDPKLFKEKTSKEVMDYLEYEFSYERSTVTN